MSTRFTTSFARQRTIRLLAGGIVLALLLSAFFPNLGVARMPDDPRYARWRAATSLWKPLGSGIHGDIVRALIVTSDGSLYAGGNFTAAGGVTASHIARWDGTAWHSLGSELAGGGYPIVYALAAGADGSLYGNYSGGCASWYRWRPERRTKQSQAQRLQYCLTVLTGG